MPAPMMQQRESCDEPPPVSIDTNQRSDSAGQLRFCFLWPHKKERDSSNGAIPTELPWQFWRSSELGPNRVYRHSLSNGGSADLDRCQTGLTGRNLVQTAKPSSSSAKPPSADCQPCHSDGKSRVFGAPSKDVLRIATDYATEVRPSRPNRASAITCAIDDGVLLRRTNDSSPRQRGAGGRAKPRGWTMKSDIAGQNFIRNRRRSMDGGRSLGLSRTVVQKSGKKMALATES